MKSSNQRADAGEVCLETQNSVMSATQSSISLKSKADVALMRSKPLQRISRESRMKANEARQMLLKQREVIQQRRRAVSAMLADMDF